MQHIPASATLHPVAQRLLSFKRRNDITGVSDDEVGLKNIINIVVIFENAGTDTLVFAQQLEQFQPGEVDVVIQATCNQDLVDPLGMLFGHVGHPLNIGRAC